MDINQNHPYYQIANTMYPRLIDGLMRTNQITPQEAQYLKMKQTGPEFSQFVMNCISSLPSLAGESQMESLMRQNLVNPMINAMRQQAMYAAAQPGPSMMWGAPVAAPGMMPAAPGYGMPGYGAPGWGGFRPAVPVAPAAPGFMRPTAPGPMFTARPGMPPPPKQQQPPAPAPKAQEPKPAVKWSAPVRDDTQHSIHEFNNGTAMSISRFQGHDGVPVQEVFVVDDRPRYLSDEEAINTYRHLLIEGDNIHKYLTVCYRKLITLNADKNAMLKLTRAVANAVSNKSESNLPERLRTLLGVCDDHPASAVTAFHKLIVDEFNEHLLCGELVDSVGDHPTWSLSVKSVQDIYNLITGNIDKNIRDTLHKIKGFDEAIATIVQNVLATVVMSTSTVRIIDPTADKSVLDIYGRAIPPIYRNDREGAWETTESFIIKYLASLKSSDGSNAAHVASQDLGTKLAACDRNFTVIQVPRIITWCNEASSNIVGWDQGKCQPKVYGADSINSNIGFFLNCVFLRLNKAKEKQFAKVTKRLICEVGEGSIKLDYGITTDGGLWVGNLRYK